MNKRSLLIPTMVVGGIVVVFTLLSAALISLFSSGPSLPLGEKVGIVEVVGPIMDSDKTVREIDEFRRDDSILAVVLRVDSPGGGVGPSQEIYTEVEKLAATKPVVVSMGSVAASGGYYVAAPAQRIVANPGTITGSIGVIMNFTNYQELLDKIGLKNEAITSGKHKDIGSPVRPMTDEDRAILQGLIDDVHQQFVSAVAKGRKLDIDVTSKLADGRIFTGRQAKEVGLVDDLGNFRDALNIAAQLADIDGEPRLIYPPEPKKDFIQYFLEETTSQLQKGLREETSTGLQYRWNERIGR